MNKKKVLVPIDGSAFSERILPEITRWFRPGKVEVILFCVADDPAQGTGVYAEIMRDSLDRGLISGRYGAQEVEYAKHPIYATQVEASVVANTRAELIPDEHKLEAQGFTVATEVAFGDPAKEIIDYVKQHDIDIVAMTTHGRTGVGRLLMGSVAEKVLHSVTIPVMLLRPFERTGMGADI